MITREEVTQKAKDHAGFLGGYEEQACIEDYQAGYQQAVRDMRDFHTSNQNVPFYTGNSAEVLTMYFNLIP